jgi:acyl-coenzyme A synthetase/AMP-(fatty) acid ligase
VTRLCFANLLLELNIFSLLIGLRSSLKLRYVWGKKYRLIIILTSLKAHQVAPAELEAHLLTHPSVADCAVISVADDEAGEVPKAFVVKSSSVGLEENDRMVAREIARHVEAHKARYKWLKGGVEFIDVIPKSPSGKILRRLLRDKEREARRKKVAKL